MPQAHNTYDRNARSDGTETTVTADSWLGLPSRRWVWAIYLILGVGPWLLLLGWVVWEHVAFVAPGAATCWTDPDTSFVTPLEGGPMLALLYGGPWLLGVLIACVSLRTLKQPSLRPTLVTLATAIVVMILLFALLPLNGQYLDALRGACGLQ